MKEPHMIRESTRFEQEVDCCDPSREGFQELFLSVDNGGIGPSDEFYVIRTTRWAFDCIDEVVALLRKAGVPQSVEAGTPP